MSFVRPSTADFEAPAGPDAVRLLRQAIAARQAEDRLAPVTVVVPSNYSALSLRRGLAAVPPGLVNVGFVVLGRLAELLGAPRLAASGRGPLPAAVLAHAVRQAVAADPGVFKEVAPHPATERALVRAYRDVRGLSPPAVRVLARHSERSADVVRLVSAVRARLAPDWYDELDLLAAAAQAVADGSAALADTGHVIVFASRPPAPAERAFIDALGDRATVIQASVDRGSAPPADELISAPDPDQEVRAVLRGIAARLADGTPLHRMAVFHPAAEPYALLLTQHLAAAGVPANGPPVRRLRDLVAGTALLGLLRLPERNWHREDVMAWLSSGPILDAGGRPVPASRWDTVSRAAGVVEGVDQWDDRLGALAASAAEELRLLAEEGGGADEDEAHRRRLERRIEDAQGLRRFVAELAAAADPGPGGRGWAALSAWAARLLDRFLGGEAAHGGWPEPEQEGWRQVRAALGELAALDPVSREGRGMGGHQPVEVVEAATFTRALDQQLDAPAARLGAFGDGVFVAPLATARGTDFDVVFVVGLAEGTLPTTAPSADAGGLLPLADDGADPVEQAHEDLLHALAAGRERVLTWPRLDPRRGRERMPSRWLLAAAGPDVLSVADLDRLAGEGAAEARPTVRSIASFAAGALALDDSAPPMSLADYDLASLARWSAAGGQARDHFLAAELPRLAAGLDAAASRSGTRLTRFDGLVGADASAAAGLGAVMSPTSMEVYAACPMRYFLRQVLRLSAPDKPEEILRLRPLDKGSLVHAVLERYVLTLLDGQPRDLARLLAIAHQAFAEIEARGLTGKPLYWRYERELLLRELRRFHDEDRLTPIAAELAFGMDGAEPVSVVLEDGRTLHFRGSADRVDVDPATGQLVVTDYKTGGLSDYEDLRRRLADDPPDPVDRGRKLQLPLYALAAAARHRALDPAAHPADAAAQLSDQPDRPVRARYWFTSERGRFEEIGYPVDGPVLARLREVLRVAADGIAAGAFPARPGEVDRATYKNCAYCDFDRLCPRDRARQWERKRTAPVLADYVALAEGQ